MSSGGGGGGGNVPANTTQVQTIREAPEIEARRLGLMDAAKELAQKRTTPPAFRIAPMSTAETEALTLARSGPAGAQMIADSASALTDAQRIAGQQFTAQNIQAAMNPFIQNVVNRVSEDYLQKERDLAAKAVASGNFGGGREGVGLAELQRGKAYQLGSIYGSGFQSALGELQTQRSLGVETALNRAQGLGALAGQQLQQREQQLAGLTGTGGLQRGIAQAELEAARQTELQRIQEPFQRVAFVSDIQSGVPSASQARLTQTSAPQPSPLGQAIGTGLGAYAAFRG